MPDTLKEQVFERLEALAAVANLSMEDRIAYDKAMDSFTVSRIVEEDVRKEGWEKGRKEGRNEERKNIARNMKSLGMTIEQIAQAAGLSTSEIEIL